jgi:hypothetical protein
MNPNYRHAAPPKKILFTKNSVWEFENTRPLAFHSIVTPASAGNNRLPRVFNPSQLTALMTCFDGDVGRRPSSILAVASINVGPTQGTPNVELYRTALSSAGFVLWKPVTPLSLWTNEEERSRGPAIFCRERAQIFFCVFCLSELFLSTEIKWSHMIKQNPIYFRLAGKCMPINCPPPRPTT